MLDVLAEVERALPQLLVPEENDRWFDVDVDYEPPRVERVWRQYREWRVYLHCIHPCDVTQALFHPHPWPSAMLILSGSYSMLLGYGKGSTAPPVRHKVILSAGSRYEMTDKDEWHCAAPFDGCAMTLMVTGAPWERWSPRPQKLLNRLEESRRERILCFFRGRYLY